MIKPNDWDSIPVYGAGRKAPEVGAYVCGIKQAQEVTLSNGSKQLVILFDILDGDYANYYEDDYKSRKANDSTAKWRGTLKTWLPRDNDFSDLNQMTKSRLKGLVTCIEESNSGYRWNWNEQSLKGLKIGILYRNEEWENRERGTRGWKAQPFIALSTATVRDGKYTLPKDKPLNGESPAVSTGTQAAQNFEYLSEDEGELPF